MRIGVFGHVGNQNLGDEALIAAVVENVRRRYPEVELRAFTTRPQDTEQRHGIAAFPIRRMNGGPVTRAARSESLGVGRDLRARLRRVPVLPGLVRAARRLGNAARAVALELRFLVQSYRRLRGTDLLLVAGSQQLNDYWGGPWAFPFTLFKWSLLARASGTRVAFLSVGAGPLDTPLGKFFVRQALRLAGYRSFRDDDARTCVLGLGVSGDHPVVPDLAFSMSVDLALRPVPRGERRIVGINPMPVFDDTYYPEHDPQVYGQYVSTLAGFADWLVERGYDLRLFATQLLVDHEVIDDVQRRMKHRGPRIVAGRIHSFDELVSVIDGLDLVVATRYHGTVFSLIRRKPVLSIAYHRKSIDLMTQLGLGEYAIDIARLTLAALQQRFVALEAQRARFTELLDRGLPVVRAQLDSQYERALSLLWRERHKPRPAGSGMKNAPSAPRPLGGSPA